MMLNAHRAALAGLVAMLVLSAQLSAQDSLAAARDLYASARYDEALAVLDRLPGSVTAIDEQQSIDLYRTLCLLAVGRDDEAARIMEAIIVRNPQFRPGDDLPPRTRIAFNDARRRVLPAIIQQQYAAAKDTFDRSEFEAAAAAFKRVLDAIHDPDIGSAAREAPLSDLLTLAEGFHDLSVKAIPPPPRAPAPEPEPPVNLPPRIYAGDEPGVRAPETIAQAMPTFPGAVPPTGLRGVLEVVIDETGSVESALMIAPISRAYDKLLLTAAAGWRFAPATLNRTPVKFRKRVQIFVAAARGKQN